MFANDAPDQPGLKTIYRSDYQPPSHWVDQVHLDFQLGEQATLVTNTMSVRRNSDVAEQPLTLDGDDLKLVSVQVDGKTLGSDEYARDSESLVIHRLPEQCEVTIQVEIYPHENKSCEGLWLASDIYCTQCEAMGFRKITYYLDRPDVMAKFRVDISADATRYPVLLSNGNRISQTELADGRHQVCWEDPYPKPSYLFALVGGDLHCHKGEFTTASGRHVDLEIWVEAENIDQCEHALGSLQRSMKWDEQIFGLEYDLDIYMIVAVNDFNMGAMENKGLNIFNSKYVLARPDTATDDDYELIEAVIAHEYFHNWTGNRVTCRDWFQLTLKEGLTVFRDQQYTSDIVSAAVKRIGDVRQLRSRQFGEDDGPMAHPIRPESYISMDNFYTVTVYDKGAEIIRMYYTLLGADGFRRGMDLYFERHDGQAVTCDDFRAAMADANDADLDQFERWYSQAGTPVLTVSGEWDEATSQYRLTCRQHYEPARFNVPGTEDRQELHIPILAGLLSKESGQPQPVSYQGTAGDSHLLQLRDEQQTFVFDNVTEQPVPSVLRHFSAPVRLQIERPRRELAFLMSHDSDWFNRWDAAQSMATDILLDLTTQIQTNKPRTLDPVFVEAFGNVLIDPELNGAIKAMILTLPSEAVLAQQTETVDPGAVHAAREYARCQLAALYRSQFTELYKEHRRDVPYNNAPEHIERRKIKNLCLAYLACHADREAIALLVHQFRSANNMTDQQAAFVNLVQIDCPERTQIIGEFYNQWHNVPLVLDKWFAIQASCHLEDCWDEMAALLDHEKFSYENPNRVRSVVGTLGGANPVQFHRPDGGGYQLVADAVLRVDQFNPQVAARLVAPFNQWKRLESNRSQLMHEQLERISQSPGLSKNVGEIVGRALG